MEGPNKMKTCSKCGHQWEDDVRICHYVTSGTRKMCKTILTSIKEDISEDKNQ